MSSVVLFLAFPAVAGDIDLSQAAGIIPPGMSGPDKKAVEMLVDEVAARRGLDAHLEQQAWSWRLGPRRSDFGGVPDPRAALKQRP